MCGSGGQKVQCKGKGRGRSEESLTPWAQLKSEPAVTSSWCPPPTLCLWALWYLHTEIKQGFVGLLGTKACVPHFFLAGYRLHSAPKTFPEFQQSRLKQLLVREGKGRDGKGREGKGYRDKGRRVKKRQCYPGAESWFPLGDTHSNIFELFCRPWHPHQMGEANWILPTSRDPRQLESGGEWW